VSFWPWQSLWHKDDDHYPVITIHVLQVALHQTTVINALFEQRKSSWAEHYCIYCSLSKQFTLLYSHTTFVLQLMHTISVSYTFTAERVHHRSWYGQYHLGGVDCHVSAPSGCNCCGRGCVNMVQMTWVYSDCPL